MSLNNIKSFENFFNQEDEKVNEGVLDFVKKLPFYDKLKEVYLQLKDKIEEQLAKLSEEDLAKIKSFTLSNESVDFELTVEKRSELVNKILKIFGVSASAMGILSAISSMIIAALNNSGTQATPWFIVGVILLVVGGAAHTIGETGSEKKKVYKASVKRPSASSRSKDPYLRRNRG